MNRKVRWGILSTAKIGREKVIPALQKAKNCEVIAIASRNLDQAQKTAELLNIPKAYASYEALLADSDIEAIYNPLPNHLHVKYTIKALEADKHVLCEKPIALSADEAQNLINAAAEHPTLKVMEAFMYKFHPQWHQVKELVKEGSIGKIKHLQTFFSYNNTDMNNIRNIAEVGGGALMDIGCYCISFSRFILGKEPIAVKGEQTIDPISKTDILSSGILTFDEQITASFTCSTKLFPYQKTFIFGDKGRIEIDYPCNAPLDEDTKVSVFTEKGEQTLLFKANQYTLQGEAFADAILNKNLVPFSLEDAFLNMKVIDEIANKTL
ncbi:MAG: Gfo/Idh/MocA family oxidoreductase [Sphingobacteriales bacterium]|nr:Gfo/Idh/MocA family oxidoreductase [Sphingobacteriales bacterium]